MLINKSNYEFFALDYLEGNLKATGLQAMRAFLQAHPDIDAELEMMKGDLLTFEADENIVYEHKESLLKEETPIIVMRPRKWYKIVAAAAIAILLIGFGAGYFAAQHLEENAGIAKVEAVKTPIESTPNLITPNKQNIAETVIPEPIVEEKTTIASNQNVKSPKVNQVVKKVTSEPIETLPIEKTIIAVVEKNKEGGIKPETTIETTPKIIEITGETTKQVVALTELPQVDITITVKREGAFPVQIGQIATAESQEEKNQIESLSPDNQRTNRLSKVKRFLGKLPFEDATLEAFVPTYLAGE